MKNHIKWLFTAPLLLCLVATLSAQKQVNNPDAIFVDTLGNYFDHYEPRHVTNKGGKLEKDLIDKVVDAAVDGWDAIFEKDRPKVIYNAFNIGIDTVFQKEKPVSTTLLSLANRDIPNTEGVVTPKSVEAPMPVFEKQEMTVRFENGQFVPIASKRDSVEKVGKGIVESTFKMNVVDFDEIDQEFFKNSSFVYNCEVYTRVTNDELESEAYKKPRVKKPKPVPPPPRGFGVYDLSKRAFGEDKTRGNKLQ